ncbi:MAG: hypothetical protein ACRECP_02615 [Methylocella sp.]
MPERATDDLFGVETGSNYDTQECLLKSRYSERRDQAERLSAQAGLQAV